MHVTGQRTLWTYWHPDYTSAFDGRMEMVENINILSSCTCQGMAHAQIFTPSPSTQTVQHLSTLRLNQNKGVHIRSASAAGEVLEKNTLRLTPPPETGKELLSTCWLVLAPSHFSSLDFIVFSSFLPIYPFVFWANSPFVEFLPSSRLRLSHLPSISLLVKRSPPRFTSSAPWVLPEEQAALTCIRLAWTSPTFGLNAPIILLNYDVLLRGCAAPSLWRSHESWLRTTDPFTEERFGTRSHRLHYGRKKCPCRNPAARSDVTLSSCLWRSKVTSAHPDWCHVGKKQNCISSVIMKTNRVPCIS